MLSLEICQQYALGSSRIQGHKNHGIISNRKQTYLITNLSLYSPIGAWEPPGYKIPKLEGLQFPSIESLHIRVESIDKLLSSLNESKAYSADPSPLPIWGQVMSINVACLALTPHMTETEPVFHVKK